SSRRGLRSFIAASASSTTAPSMQPPETEPTIAPASSTASWLPTGRGEAPQVVTTVASATPLPSARQAAAWVRTSSLAISGCIFRPPIAAFSRILVLQPGSASGLRGRWQDAPSMYAQPSLADRKPGNGGHCPPPDNRALAGVESGRLAAAALGEPAG